MKINVQTFGEYRQVPKVPIAKGVIIPFLPFGKLPAYVLPKKWFVVHFSNIVNPTQP